MKLKIRNSGIKRKKQGFLNRMRTVGGRKVIKRRRKKGKRRLTAWN